MVVLAVAAVLFSAGMFGARGFVQGTRASAALNQMIGAVQYTRHAAVTHRTTATLCPGSAGRCGRRNTWHDGGIVFLDRNRNGRIDGPDRILRVFPPLPPGHRIYWRSFRNRSYLSINSRGLTDWQNGHLQYCPPDGDPRHARQVIVNAQARVRRARDRDGDGVAEDAQGRPLRCP